MNEYTGTEGPSRWLWLALIVLGGVMLLCGGLSFFGAFWLASTKAAQENVMDILVFGFGWAALFLGTALVMAGRGGWAGRPSRPFYSQWGWLIWLSLLIFAGLGTQVVPNQIATRPLLALFHASAIVAPALFFFSLATLMGGRKNAPTVRQSILAFSGGASVAIPAIVAEIVGVVVIGGLILLVSQLIPSWNTDLTALGEQLRRWSNTSADPETMTTMLMRWISSPPIVLGMVLTLSVLTPLVEELGKGIMVGILGAFRKVRPSQAFLWGAAAGIGFAFVEGIGNGMLGVNQDAVSWLQGAGGRIFATAMHALTTGMIGLGWAYGWQKRRWALPLAYLGAVFFHGLWNFSVVLAVVGGSMMVQQQIVGALLAGLGALLTLSLAFLAPAGLIAIPWAFNRRDRNSEVPIPPFPLGIPMGEPAEAEFSAPELPAVSESPERGKLPPVEPFSEDPSE